LTNSEPSGSKHIPRAPPLNTALGTKPSTLNFWISTSDPIHNTW
jgi:hypothetical protein